MNLYHTVTITGVIVTIVNEINDLREKSLLQGVGGVFFGQVLGGLGYRNAPLIFLK